MRYKRKNFLGRKTMQRFLVFTLCFGLACLIGASSSFAQYGKATEQNIPTAAPDIKSDTSKDENSGKRKYVKPATPAIKPANIPTPTGASKSSAIPSDANISVYYDDFSIKKTFGGQTFCQMTFYVENNTNMMLDALILSMKWSGLSTNLNIAGVPANDLKAERYALVGSGCYTMGEEPKLTIEKCMMRSFTAAGKVIDIPEDKCKSIVVFK